MDIRNNFSNVSRISIEQMQEQLSSKTRLAENTGGRTFAQIFEEKETQSLKFSKHADERLSDRNINLTDDQLSRLCEGTKKAGEKGINESLVLMDNLAFIVNTKNNTVITAMDSSNTSERTFTNIDGAVIV